MEGVAEPGDGRDRMLTQVLHSGGLDGVKAVLLGEFTGGDDNNEFALRRFADTFDKPVFRSDLFGHGRKNYPLVFNSPAVIQSDGNEQNGFVLIIPVRCLP